MKKFVLLVIMFCLVTGAVSAQSAGDVAFTLSIHSVITYVINFPTALDKKKKRLMKSVDFV